MYVSAVIKHHQSESDSSIFRLTILLQSSLGMVTSTISYRFVNQSTNSLRDHIHTYCKLLMQVKRAKTSKRGIAKSCHSNTAIDHAPTMGGAAHIQNKYMHQSHHWHGSTYHSCHSTTNHSDQDPTPRN